MNFFESMNFQLLKKLLIIVVFMFGFGYALVPLYYKICEVTGINFLTRPDGIVAPPKNTQIDTSRQITVEFDANAHGPWRFRPTVSTLQVNPGQVSQVVYEVVNMQPRAIDAQAIPSYAPVQAAAFFKKIECFCFTQQTLASHEAKQMPVLFYIDPALPKEVKTVTVSYTFFEVGKKSSSVPK